MEKIGNPQTKDRIADMLRGEILSGRIADGEELAQEQLAEILEVSRMPVREAFQILELEGLLRRLLNRHMQVVGVCERTLYENMALVAAVESEIAAILTRRPDAFPEAMDFDADRTFHRWFSEQANNHYIRQTHRRLLLGYPEYAWNRGGPGRFSQQNAGIWDAVKSRNIPAIQDKIHEYYHTLAASMLAYVKERIHEQPETN